MSIIQDIIAADTKIAVSCVENGRPSPERYLAIGPDAEMEIRADPLADQWLMIRVDGVVEVYNLPIRPIMDFEGWEIRMAADDRKIDGLTLVS